MPTIQYGKQSLPAGTLKEDKRAAKKIGPVGMGRRALYLNSFYISRMYYVLWTEVKRVYKLVAMSKGGFTGIGAFGSMSYLVVELRDGRTKKCQIKYENQTDQALEWIAAHHPEIPVRSENAQRKLDEKAQRESREIQIPPGEDAQRSILLLEEAQQYLEAEPSLYQNLSRAAAKKRAQQNIPAGRRALGISIFVCSIALLAAGIFLTIQRAPYGIYMILFGGAFLLFSLSGNLIPIGRNSPRSIESQWQDAVRAQEAYLSGWPAASSKLSEQGIKGGTEGFPVPARYAHPVVLERMIRAIRQGRAKDPDKALGIVKEDLKKLNRSVKVSQEEYDEVVAVKPMFLVSEYQ